MNSKHMCVTILFIHGCLATQKIPRYFLTATHRNILAPDNRARHGVPELHDLVEASGEELGEGGVRGESPQLIRVA